MHAGPSAASASSSSSFLPALSRRTKTLQIPGRQDWVTAGGEIPPKQSPPSPLCSPPPSFFISCLFWNHFLKHFSTIFAFNHLEKYPFLQPLSSFKYPFMNLNRTWTISPNSLLGSVKLPCFFPLILNCANNQTLWKRHTSSRTSQVLITLRHL